jgi:hypothetical protein
MMKFAESADDQEIQNSDFIKKKMALLYRLFFTAKYDDESNFYNVLQDWVREKTAKFEEGKSQLASDKAYQVQLNTDMIDVVKHAVKTNFGYNRNLRKYADRDWLVSQNPKDGNLPGMKNYKLGFGYHPDNLLLQ